MCLSRLALAVLVVLPGFMPEATLMAQTRWQQLLEQRDRLATDLDRDASAQPAAILELMQLQPGMRVLDFQAGTGYFSELLARVVGPTGVVYAHNHERNGLLDPEQLAARYDGRLKNVEQLFAHHNDLELPPQSLDRVLMNMVYHDTYWFREDVDWGPVDHKDFLARIKLALKPDGLLLLVDHAARAGEDPYVSALQTHRIDPAIISRDFSNAGFTLLRRSDVLRNADDDPLLSVFDEQVYRRTDRVVWLFGLSTGQ